LKGDDEEVLMLDDSWGNLSNIEETRKGLDAAIVNAPVIEILNQVLGLVQSQAKVMGEVRKSVGELSGKVDKVIKVGEKHESMLASIQADLKSQNKRWCSFCESTSHDLSWCKAKVKCCHCKLWDHTSVRCPKPGQKCLECGQSGHEAMLHFVTDPKKRANIIRLHGKEFVFLL